MTRSRGPVTACAPVEGVARGRTGRLRQPLRGEGGRLEDLKRLSGEIDAQLRADKPDTVLYLMYLDEGARRSPSCIASPTRPPWTVISKARTSARSAAFEVMEPRGWEIYGRPSDEALDTMRAGAAAAGVSLTVRPELVAGFLRLAPG